MVTERAATLADLARIPDHGKAELVDGKLVAMPPTGGMPGRLSLKIAVALTRHEEETGTGHAFGDNVGFVVNLPHRRSFSPDAAYSFDADVSSDDFVVGAPAFAVEVRSKGDYGPAQDAVYAAKRADYFAAGTQVVWDVNPHDRTVTKYTAVAPGAPQTFGAGAVADAEPALPGWCLAVDTLFR